MMKWTGRADVRVTKRTITRILEPHVWWMRGVEEEEEVVVVVLRSERLVLPDRCCDHHVDMVVQCMV